MFVVRVAINGFGRIGRIFLRQAMKEKNIDIVAINDLTDAKTLAHLLKYDSVHGVFDADVTASKYSIFVNKKEIPIYAIKEPGQLPWKKHSVDVVLESTGVFRDKAGCMKHIEAGAKKVLLSAPPKGDGDMKQIVLGANEHTLRKDDVLVSMASCTTNCLVPLVMILDENFSIENGCMTTVHAYTNDQNILDLPHKDLRRARAAALSIIPTTSGATDAVVQIIPRLKGKVNGLALRVPVPDGSIVDFVAKVKKNVTAEEVNAAFKKAAAGKLKGILQYTEDEIVSSDIVGNPHSSIFDAKSTMVIDGNLVKVLSWYDNELGYSTRLVDMVKYMMKK
jgi:glyceraldehyde 3-phosphate dehydrogenase